MKSGSPAPHGITLEHRFAPRMVVFSHGFGVSRDGGGLFTELTENLPDDFGYVLFDYNDQSGKTTVIADFTEQVRRLTEIVRWTQQQPGVIETHVIAHSMGCVTTALAEPNINGHFVFLAPPLQIGERTREYYTTKPGAKLDGHRWLIPEKAGSTSVVSLKLIDEFEKIDAGNTLLRFADKQRFALVTAGQDEVLDDEDYTAFSDHSKVDFVTITDADHSFKGESRKKLISLLSQLLQ